ncbi:MAG TPA: DUF6265 family protein [Candidatus Acidoferrales bacterium]|nr:DUF6265 family protein [Candidatus Acidoferrales bacterium]
MCECGFDSFVRGVRRSRLSSGLCVIVLFSAAIAFGPALLAQEAANATEPSAFPAAPFDAPQTPATSVKPASLADLGWLEGHWTGEWGPRTATQIWTAPRAGVMLGTLQIVENNKTSDVEFFMIRQTARGVEYRVLHFTSSMKPWAPATLFLSSTDSRQFVFKNAADGAPQQIVLTRSNSNPDTYTNEWEIHHQASDSLNWEITFHRQAASAGSDGRR